MKFFIDTEFIERGPNYPVQLISIGIVAENGKAFYAENSEFKLSDCSPWLLENVIPHLNDTDRAPLAEIAKSVQKWIRSIAGKAKLEFWGYYCDYDWVVFCQMFGTMMDLPKGWPMYCRDIKQLCDDLGNPKLPPQESTEHNALADAKWNKTAYEFLKQREK